MPTAAHRHWVHGMQPEVSRRSRNALPAIDNSHFSPKTPTGS